MKMNQMRKSVAVIAVFLLIAMMAGCGGGSAEAGGEEGQTVKIGVFNNNTADSGGWTKSHYDAVEYLKAQVPEAEVIWVEEVPETGSDSARVIDELAAEGCNIIVGSSFGHMDAVYAGAERHPDIHFFHCQGYVSRENMSVFDVRDYEAIFLTGYAAGRMAKTDEIGFVAAQPMPTVIRAVNGFALGARYANPNATVRVIFTNSWYDPAREKEAADGLIDAGCSVVGMHASSPAVPQTCQEKGAYTVGFHEDMSGFAPDAMLTSFIWNWGPIYEHMAKSYLDGTIASEDIFWGLEKGCGGIAPLNTSIIPEDIVADIEALRGQLETGEVKVFAGELKDNTGTVRVAAGEEITTEAVKSMDWLVENVKGTLGN